MDPSLKALDQTTLPRRSNSLNEKLVPVVSRKSIQRVTDSIGLAIMRKGECAAAKHGGRERPGGGKLHIGVDRAGTIRAQVLAGSTGERCKDRA